ncbi:MAG: dihydroorotate dehydrogenase electron transfer subunit [Chitinispirillales bacterium]|jgi:dihydroorotate dehydrogenase electron transfer subunit|nr:dihydroorotate dehydrogenase electron transfer subunit [Chitinispirillales bacterium]
MLKQLQSQVLSNRQISADFFELSMRWDKTAGIALPGQFLTIRVSQDSVPLLRRPFAFAGFDEPEQTASIIYQKRGRGTEILCGKQAGESLDVIGPLGNHFPVNDGQGESVAAAGGIGLGPILFLVNYLRERDVPVTFIFGCRNSSYIPDNTAFKTASPNICTDDGSVGFKGNTISYLEQNIKINDKSVLYGCGPEAMLKGLSGFADSVGAASFVSVEQVMACGVGACMGCVVKTASGYARSCKEGPVFSAKDIVWE